MACCNKKYKIQGSLFAYGKWGKRREKEKWREQNLIWKKILLWMLLIHFRCFFSAQQHNVYTNTVFKYQFTSQWQDLEQSPSSALLITCMIRKEELLMQNRRNNSIAVLGMGKDVWIPLVFTANFKGKLTVYSAWISGE